MSAVHAVGIDLGTTYSCLSHLTPDGRPVTLPNADGELSTPSVVLFEGDEVVVGTEALRNAVVLPDRVVLHAKRYMGDEHKCWVMDGRVYRPSDISALILRHLLQAAEERLGEIRHAVITVPAQFSDAQRQDTIEAGHKAGLDRIDLINEPVAAALCYVLGAEGMWFSELADTQKIMVYDLGGGTFDLSLVKYAKNAVTVIASAGDLHLGGLDWNAVLAQFACEQFLREVPDDPRLDRHTMQSLANEVEQCKRALSQRPQANLTLHHAGRRKTFTVSQELFEHLTSPLVKRTEDITLNMVQDHAVSVRGEAARQKLSSVRPGWQAIDAVLVTGGASRMPMIRNMLKRISGTTLNTALSPDQSICHGAAYYAGMLLSNQQFAKSVLASDVAARLALVRQQSVNARALGVLVTDRQTGARQPHYILPANTPLPCQTRHEYGTVTENQKRVHLHIIESGTSTTDEYVRLGTCVIDDLPQVLPVNSPIEVTIRYDEQACVHVSARDVTSGRTAHAQIFRRENVVTRPRREAPEVLLVDAGDEAGARASVAGARQHMLQSTFVPPPTGGKEAAASRKTPPAAARPAPAASAAPAPPTPAARPAKSDRQKRLEQADRPLPLCSSCGEALDARGKCPVCQPVTTSTVRRAATPPSRTGGPPAPVQKPTTGRPPASPPPPARALVKEDEAVFDIAIYNVETEPLQSPPPPPSGRRPGPGSPRPRRRPPGGRSNS